MIQPSLNNVLVKIKHKFTKGITGIAKIAAIQNLSSIELADYITITGEVVSTPVEISKRRDYTGFSTEDIKTGDTAIFSHLVVNDYVQESPEQEPKFRNSVWVNGGEYFVCDIQRLFAVIRDGEIRMQNGYVMLADVQKPSAIFIPRHTKKAKEAISGILSHIGEPVSGCQKSICKEGDNIYLNPSGLQSYEINGKQFFITTQNHILGHVTG